MARVAATARAMGLGRARAARVKGKESQELRLSCEVPALTWQGLLPGASSQTPAAFRKQRKGLREVLLLKKGKPVRPVEVKRAQTLKIEAKRQHSVGLRKPEDTHARVRGVFL